METYSWTARPHSQRLSRLYSNGETCKVKKRDKAEKHSFDVSCETVRNEMKVAGV